MATESVRMHAKGTKTSCCSPACCYLSHFIYMWSVNVNRKILKASVEWTGWGGMHSHFCVQPNYCVEFVLWLCCGWGCDKKGMNCAKMMEGQGTIEHTG